ncbi:MAG TPA: hypothetical protein VE077_05720 [Candidatus Methylomirabilis sp.]|nr:hypothetical protein [Candidatus Methylomirabilis sp.]
MSPSPHSRLLLVLLLASAGFWATSCTQPLGPAYSIESQEIRVRFHPSPDSHILVDSAYKLRNVGTRPISSLPLRLPGRLFHLTSDRAAWDGVSLATQNSDANPRETVFALPQPWDIGQTHSFEFSSEFTSAEAGASGFRFSSDAFFLPSEGWVPELLPAAGLFGIGGVPPKQWRLSVTVPEDFLVHTSGRPRKSSRNGGEITSVSLQGAGDRYPFVVAGRYRESALSAGSRNVFLWTRSQENADSLRQFADDLARAMQTYDATFGSSFPAAQPFWIVECPVVPGCFAATESSYASFLGAERGTVTSDLASLDTLLLDFTGGPPRLAAAAPGLAASWLGYGQNPGFHGQQPPLTALPAFASALGGEAIAGPSARAENIRRALRVIPRRPGKTEDPAVTRAKSLLFFYALQDRFGEPMFRQAINHVLTARRGRGFNLDDLIAAFDQETHQNTAEFVRLWMKHPGVPDDFRARYEDPSTSSAAISKETIP